VGVVGDVKVRGLERTSEPQMYMPTTLSPAGALTFFDPKDLVIRASGSLTALIPSVRSIIHAADPEQPISDVMPLTEVLDQQTASRAAQVRALLALALIAVLLAGLGIHGVLAYTVTQQRLDIAVRLALGAEPGRIARGVVWNGLSIVLMGMIPGLFLAFTAGRSMSSLLFGVQPHDPVVIAVTIGLCLFMSLTGALLPAFRSVRVSPMSVMRSE
jgi:ABC-type antimicrobial peptide transport system permease subunit